MALAKVVGARERKDGYVEGKEYLVSWCVGHLVVSSRKIKFLSPAQKQRIIISVP